VAGVRIGRLKSNVGCSAAANEKKMALNARKKGSQEVLQIGRNHPRVKEKERRVKGVYRWRKK